MFDADNVLSQIDDLLGVYQELQGRSQYPEDLADLHSESAELVVRLRSAVFRLAPTSGAYVEEAKAIESEKTFQRIPKYVGILRAMRADIHSGWLSTIEELIHAKTFSDFLDMATELGDKGYKDASAVIAGSVLEGHLRTLATSQKLSLDTRNGKPKKADTLNADIHKANVYNLLQQKQVTAWLDLRNNAAHGKYDQYAHKQVTELIVSVREFIIKYPA